MDIISLVIYVVIVGLIFWLIWWFIGYMAIPEPFNKIARVLVGLVALLFALNILLSLLGAPVLHLTPLKLK